MGTTLMFWMNLLATIMSLQPLAIHGIICNSLFANLVTGCQYRGFVETIKHAVMYHTPEANCQEKLISTEDKDLNGY